jgi:hypothetical protein
LKGSIDLSGTDHANARKWRAQDPTRSIDAQRSSSTATIGGIIVVIPVSDVINPHNPNLTFIYQRVSPSKMEEIWVPIFPKWTRTPPTPPQTAP